MEARDGTPGTATPLHHHERVELQVLCTQCDLEYQRLLCPDMEGSGSVSGVPYPPDLEGVLARIGREQIEVAERIGDRPCCTGLHLPGVCPEDHLRRGDRLSRPCLYHPTPDSLRTYR